MEAAESVAADSGSQVLAWIAALETPRHAMASTQSPATEPDEQTLRRLWPLSSLHEVMGWSFEQAMGCASVRASFICWAREHLNPKHPPAVRRAVQPHLF